jgi:excisionase family DNA binding protein
MHYGIFLPVLFNCILIVLYRKERLMSAHEVPELLTVHEVAERLRVDDTTVRRWIKNGVMDAVELPHANKRCAYRIRRKTLEDLLLVPAA